MKPPKQLKRILRVKVLKEDGKIRVFGSLIPQPSENCPKFTTFFKQIKILGGPDKNMLYNVKSILIKVEKALNKLHLKGRHNIRLPLILSLTIKYLSSTFPNI